MYCGIVKLVHFVACLISSICALHIGLLSIGYDMYRFIPLLSEHNVYVDYVIGVAGAVSLTLLVLGFVMPSCGTGCMSNCTK